MKVILTPRQELFVKKSMKMTKGIIEPNSPIYWDFVLKMLNEQYLSPTALATDDARKMMYSIVERISYAYLDEEIDAILAEVQQVPLDEIESTKSQSLKKVTNFTENHKQVVSMINKYPKSSRRELAVHLGWSINRVTPRIKELLEMNKIKVSGTKYDEKTERNVEVLEIF